VEQLSLAAVAAIGVESKPPQLTETPGLETLAEQRGRRRGGNLMAIRVMAGDR